MSIQTQLSNLKSKFVEYVSFIKHENKKGRTNDTGYAETLFREFLNTAFNWKLKNGKPYQKGYDLIDSDDGTLVQVTSNGSQVKKIHHTLERITEAYVQEASIKKVIILFISTDREKRVELERVSAGVKYLTWSLFDLHDEIAEKVADADVLTELLRLMEHVMRSEPVGGETPMRTAAPVIQRAAPLPKGLVIDRSALVSDIFAFTQGGHGALIGGPGAGKSEVMNSLQRHCYRQNVPCYIIRINELTSATEQELATELDCPSDWLGSLDAVDMPAGTRGVLLFDAYDAAKDEALKAAVLRYVKLAVRRLAHNWSVVASVRTFDATRSRNLLKLFGDDFAAGRHGCRHMEIPYLTEIELAAVGRADEGIGKVMRSARTSLLALLRIPYFLKLLDRVLISSAGSHVVFRRLGHIETEDQLLQLFWELEVTDATDKEIFLRDLTRKTVERKSLLCPKGDVITYENAAVYDRLVSNGVITVTSSTKENISFAHNIMLEFAISLYVLPENESGLFRLVRDSEQLPFIFRQSFYYLYSRIWRDDRSSFWNHYLMFSHIEEPLFRIYHQSILNQIAAAFYQDEGDLKPVLSFKDEQKRAVLVRKLLEALRFNRDGILEDRDIRLFYHLSPNLQDVYLWNMGVLVDIACKQLLGNCPKKIGNILAATSANVLQFVLTERKASSRKWLIEANGNWAVSNLCKTIKYQKRPGAKLINECLNLLLEEDFPISFIRRITEHIVGLITVTPKLGSKAYKKIYFHHELSTKETSFGSAVVNLVSNRQQDYNSCVYWLEREFVAMLRAVPIETIKLGLAVANKGTLEMRSYAAKYMKIHQLSFDGVGAVIINDLNFNDPHDSDKDHGPLSHVFNILAFIEEVRVTDPTAGSVYLMYLFRNAETTTIWRIVIDYVKDQCAFFKMEAVMLLTNKLFYVLDETVSKMAALLRAITTLLTSEERSLVEEAILGLLELHAFNNKRDAEDVVARLLKILNEELIQKERSKDIIRRYEERQAADRHSPGASDENQFSSPRYSGHSDGEIMPVLEDRLRRLFDAVEAFNESHEGNDHPKPAANVIAELLPAVNLLFEESSDNKVLNSQLQKDLDDAVGKFVKIAAKVDKLTKADKKAITELALFYVGSDRYRPPAYEPGSRTAQIIPFVPNARIDCVLCLMRLLKEDKTGKVAPAILALTSDNSTLSRIRAFETLPYFWKKDKEAFWKAVMDRAPVEMSGACLQEIIEQISYTNVIDEHLDRVEIAAAVIMHNLEKGQDEAPYELWSWYAVLLVRMVIRRQSKMAGTIMLENTDKGTFTQQVLRQIAEAVSFDLREKDTIVKDEDLEKLTGLAQSLIFKCFENIRHRGLNHSKDDFRAIDGWIERLNAKYSEIKEGKQEAFAARIKASLQLIIDQSGNVQTGFMVAHTGYYFVELMIKILGYDPIFALAGTAEIVRCAAANGFTYDSSTLQQIVSFTEIVLVDHKHVLHDDANFKSLLGILDRFVDAGSQEAIELTFRLKEIF